MGRPFRDFVRKSRRHLIPALCIGFLLATWGIRLLMPKSSVDFSWMILSDEGEANGHVPKIHGFGRPAIGNDTDLSDPDAPFIGWPLRRACSEVSEWVEGLVWTCDNNWGGIGNVRNFILTCIRYAIEAGVTGLVLPTIGKRSDDDIADYMSGKESQPFSYMFDEDNFRQAMGDNCPQITIYDSLHHVPNVTAPRGSWESDIQKIDPRQYHNRGSCEFAELDHHTDRFGGKAPSSVPVIWIFRRF